MHITLQLKWIGLKSVDVLEFVHITLQLKWIGLKSVDVLEFVHITLQLKWIGLKSVEVLEFVHIAFNLGEGHTEREGGGGGGEMGPLIMKKKKPDIFLSVDSVSRNPCRVEVPSVTVDSRLVHWFLLIAGSDLSEGVHQNQHSTRATHVLRRENRCVKRLIFVRISSTKFRHCIQWSWMDLGTA